MKYKNKILTFLITMILMWKLSGSVFLAYGSAAQSGLENAIGVDASVTVQETKEPLNVKDKVTLNIHAENTTEKKEVLRLYFSEIEGNLTEDKNQWGIYLDKVAQQIIVHDFQEKGEIDISVKSFRQEETDGILKQYRNDETEEGIYYAELELPTGTYTDFSLTVTSKMAGSIAVIPVFGKESFIYGNAAVICWEEIEQSTNQEETQDKVQDETNLVPEICKFRTCVPKKRWCFASPIWI